MLYPPKGYRQLNNDEIIQDGDMMNAYLNSKFNYDIEKISIGTLLVPSDYFGKVVRKFPNLAFFRKIESLSTDELTYYFKD